MRPKSLPLAIICEIAIFLGTALMAIAIGLPRWIITSYRSEHVETGLFEVCEEGRSCRDRDDETDELRLVIAICLGGCISGLLAFALTSTFFVMFCRRVLNSCFKFLPWLTLFWSLIAAGAIIVGLILFQEREYDSSDPYNHLGISFVFCAIGGGLVALGGLTFFCVSQRLISHLKRVELKELQRYNVRVKTLSADRPTGKY